MIPRAFITEWRARAPWVSDAQIEQDLVIERTIQALFSDPMLATCLAFRGGTALYKLSPTEQVRYSEDIDLVQRQPEGVGPILDRIREVLSFFPEAPSRSLRMHEARVVFRYRSETEPITLMRLKIEINTREHGAFEGYQSFPHRLESSWYSGSATIVSFTLEELLGTKLRALYQRRKGRDLFDLWLALTTRELDAARIVRCLQWYLGRERHTVTRQMFEENLRAKATDRGFRSDLDGLLIPSRTFDVDAAIDTVCRRLLSLLP